MSTTFDVYPGLASIPTFANLLERSTAELHRFLESVDIQARPQIRVQLLRKENNAALVFELDDPAQWGKDVYAWFSVGTVAGGADAYFENSPESMHEFWEEELTDPKYELFRPRIRSAEVVGHCWSFRRSAGQSATINIAYGLIAASMAELTDGFVHSIDSAWDWELMPALPLEFLSWYFRPECTKSKERRDWAQRCLTALPQELGGS